MATTYVSHAVGLGNLDKWSEGPALPEARSDAAYVVLGNTLYVIGGYGPDGKPDHHHLQPDDRQRRDAGRRGRPRTRWPCPSRGPARSAVAVSDGHRGRRRHRRHGTHPQRLEEPQGPHRRAWQPWVAQRPLVRGERRRRRRCASATSSSSSAAGTSRAAPVATVQQGLVGGGPPRRPRTRTSSNRGGSARRRTCRPPGPNMAGFTANGVIYVQGGADAVGPEARDLVGRPRRRTASSPPGTTCPSSTWARGSRAAAGWRPGRTAFILGGRTTRRAHRPARRAPTWPRSRRSSSSASSG